MAENLLCVMPKLTEDERWYLWQAMTTHPDYKIEVLEFLGFINKEVAISQVKKLHVWVAGPHPIISLIEKLERA